MKLLFTTILLLSYTLLSAITTIDPVTGPKVIFEEQSSSIDQEMSDLNDLNQLIIDNNYTFDELQLNHAESVNAVNLSAEEEGILDSHPDSPLGIGGFWWGFVLGWVGMLIVYLSMDEGEGRKEQVKNALIGCLIAVAFWTVLWVVVIAAAT
jgi:hypothetical protein